MFTVRTTVSLHSERLPVLFQTWMSAVNRSNIFIVTDGIEKVLHFRALEAGTGRGMGSINGWREGGREGGVAGIDVSDYCSLLTGMKYIVSVPGYER